MECVESEKVGRESKEERQREIVREERGGERGESKGERSKSCFLGQCKQVEKSEAMGLTQMSGLQLQPGQ